MEFACDQFICMNKCSKIFFRYDIVYINLSQKPEWYQGKVPGIVLENGETLYESLIISEYLDEAYPEHNLFPKDPLAKAKDKLLIEKFNQVSTPLYKVSIYIFFMK